VIGSIFGILNKKMIVNILKERSYLNMTGKGFVDFGNDDYYLVD